MVGKASDPDIAGVHIREGDRYSTEGQILTGHKVAGVRGDNAIFIGSISPRLVRAGRGPVANDLPRLAGRRTTSRREPFGKLAGTIVLGRKFEIYTGHLVLTGLALDTQVGQRLRRIERGLPSTLTNGQEVAEIFQGKMFHASRIF